MREAANLKRYGTLFLVLGLRLQSYRAKVFHVIISF